MVRNEYFTLNNNRQIPKIGFGTWQISNDDAINATKIALKNGYKHIDTAIAYENETGVGIAIKESGIDRKDLFVTSKIPASIKTYEGAKKCIEESLKRLNLEYLDLMLIHAPKPWNEMWDENAYRYFKENVEVYRALEEAYIEGKILSIGVSNFNIEDMKNILSHCKVIPQVNQICVHIGNTPKELISFCKENHILVEAYSPIATGRLLNNDLVKNMANKYNVSIANLCVRYCLDIDTLPLPKSNTEQHIIDNLNVDFDISKEDLDILYNV